MENEVLLDDIMDSDEENDQRIRVLAAAVAVVEYYNTYLCKEPCRDSELSGHQYVREVLQGHPARCFDQFRMDKSNFLKLCSTLKERKLLEDSRWISAEEQLAMFLLTLGHNERNRIVQERFQHSGETVSRHFNAVLKGVLQYSKEVIRPPSFSEIPPEIRHNPRYYPWFKDCVGAIDGTHIKAIVPATQQLSFINRKGVATQNVMAACSFDLLFTYVYAGWEGSANDSRILWEALQNKTLNFPHPPKGKYYVVDAGYPNMPGFLAPYRKTQYHLQQYKDGGTRRLGRKELFNYAHSSLRNAIERSFGVLKARFPILKEPPSFPYSTQVDIVIAACTIHNFIRIQGKGKDVFFEEYKDEEKVVEKDNLQFDDQCISQSSQLKRKRRNEMNDFRDGITDAMESFRNLGLQK